MGTVSQAIKNIQCCTSLAGIYILRPIVGTLSGRTISLSRPLAQKGRLTILLSAHATMYNIILLNIQIIVPLANTPCYVRSMIYLEN